MNLNPNIESTFSGIRDESSYGAVAGEYYDSILHPTCADFRTMAKRYLTQLFESERPAGTLADLGSGFSLVAELKPKKLVLVDESVEMLSLNDSSFEKRNVDVQKEPFGKEEFDWVFAILADPYNTNSAWKNIKHSLKQGGQCVFVVPSYAWSLKFRLNNKNERQDHAAFLTKAGVLVYVPSIILSPEAQSALIKMAGLQLTSVTHVEPMNLAELTSPKLRDVLSIGDPVLDVYRIENTRNP